MRTIVYIDGFNFYYNCVRGTAYKWLDLKEFIKPILNPDHEIIKIRYFTAPPLKEESKKLQRNYFKALKSRIPEFSFLDGFFYKEVKKMRRAEYPYNEVLVKKTEEKQSDVNLATEMLNDAWLDRYDCAILVSGDSDMAAAIRHIKENASTGALPKKFLGVIVPAYTKKGIVYAEGLKKEKPDFIRVIASDKIRAIDGNLIAGMDINTEDLLKKCQMPYAVTGKNGKIIRKPPEW